MTQATVAYQGVPGAYSHLACQESRPSYSPVPCASFEEVFGAVEAGEASLGMIPIENSVGGRVADIHHLLPESTLHIIDEHFQAVKHHLLGVKGAALDDIKQVYSHPQALSQCRKNIIALGFERCAFSDTAGAAREIGERNDKSLAAVASSLAAQTYDLEILKAPFEDLIGNTTRFIVLSQQPIRPDKHTPCMTSIVFRVRSVPAALYKTLGGFATNKVNLTKLESYIVDSSFQAAQFYAEFEGHPDDDNVKLALEELKFFSSTLRLIGTYPRHPFRHSS